MEWNMKLKQARKNVRMTQEELGNKLGVCRSTIANYELGRRKPSFLELKQIADILRVDVNYLVEGGEVEPKEELLTRASDVFSNIDLSQTDKDMIFQDIMEIYMKGKKSSATTTNKHRNKRTL